MEIHNRLPLLLECLKRWEKLPSEKQFTEEYARPMESSVGDFFGDFYENLLELDWAQYRKETLRMDPSREEGRLLKCIEDVEGLFGFRLEGQAFLLGAFTVMDGYARFDRGTHQVFLGVDESHGVGRYLDVLITHELTHVARESRPEVWEGFGLNPKMTQNEFTDSQPVIEHLMGEGFSCTVSEILVPGEPIWTYAYQSEESLSRLLADGAVIDEIIHQELRMNGDYGRLYGIRPVFAHYFWAWQWTRQVLTEHAGGDPRRLVSRCSKDFMEDALKFTISNKGRA